MTMHSIMYLLVSINNKEAGLSVGKIHSAALRHYCAIKFKSKI